VTSQLHDPAALPPGKEEVGCTPDPVWTTWRKEKNSLTYQDSKSDPSVVHPVASRYTDCTIPALQDGHRIVIGILNKRILNLGGKTPEGNAHRHVSPPPPQRVDLVFCIHTELERPDWTTLPNRNGRYE
jgi:hypothetical protein